jgi:hypothetical protein
MCAVTKAAQQNAKSLGGPRNNVSMRGPFLIAIGIVVAAALTRSLRRSQNPWAQALARPRGVLPTGPGGAWTRSDHLRASAAQALTFALAVAAGLAIFSMADHWQNGSTMNTAISLPGLAVFFYGLFFLWLACRSLIRAALARHSSP